MGIPVLSICVCMFVCLSLSLSRMVLFFTLFPFRLPSFFLSLSLWLCRVRSFSSLSCALPPFLSPSLSVSPSPPVSPISLPLYFSVFTVSLSLFPFLLCLHLRLNEFRHDHIGAGITAALCVPASIFCKIRHLPLFHYIVLVAFCQLRLHERSGHHRWRKAAPHQGRGGRKVARTKGSFLTVYTYIQSTYIYMHVHIYISRVYIHT